MKLKTIRSRYDGKCKRCKREIRMGESIRWSKETGALCPRCADEHERGTQGQGQNGTPQTQGNEQESSGQNFTPTLPTSTERNGELYFTIDWRELRETVKSVLNGDSLKTRIAGNREMIESHTQKVRSFHGYTRNQLTRWVTEGYQGGTIGGLGNFTPPLREKRHYIFNEDGDEIHVDRALSGEDNYAGDWTQRERIPGVAVECEIMFAAMVKAEVVNAYNTWIARAVYALEAAGIDCDITLKFSSDNATGEGKMVHTIVKVKSENEAVDFQAFSPMLSPAALRTFGFTAICLHADSRGKRVPAGLGHGRNSVRPKPDWGVTWDAERRVLKVDCPYIPDSFPEGKMDAAFRAALREMKA